jgi:hypothetical protein
MLQAANIFAGDAVRIVFEQCNYSLDSEAAPLEYKDHIPKSVRAVTVGSFRDSLAKNLQRIGRNIIGVRRRSVGWNIVGGSRFFRIILGGGFSVLVVTEDAALSSRIVVAIASVKSLQLKLCSWRTMADAT